MASEATISLLQCRLHFIDFERIVTLSLYFIDFKLGLHVNY